MDVDLALMIAGVLIGVVVGLTGMGGGALMTPVLVLFFGVPPLAAVSSDLVVSAVMKPVGALVHLRRRTVNLRLVGWLCLGSVPAAFAGCLVTRSFGPGPAVQHTVRLALGIALLLAACGLIVKAYVNLVARARRRAGQGTAPPAELVVHPIRTALIGAVGGLIVGLTSVGSGSLIIIALVALYPTLNASRLVGTDLVQAVPLVLSAALGHILFGDFRFDLTASLLLGCLPGVYVGAQLSAHAPGGVVRRALSLVLLASGLKLLNVGDATTLAILLALVTLGSGGWMVVRHVHGMPATYRIGRRLREWQRPEHIRRESAPAHPPSG